MFDSCWLKTSCCATDFKRSVCQKGSSETKVLLNDVSRWVNKNLTLNVWKLWSFSEPHGRGNTYCTTCDPILIHTKLKFSHTVELQSCVCHIKETRVWEHGLPFTGLHRAVISKLLVIQRWYLRFSQAFGKGVPVSLWVMRQGMPRN